MNDFAIVETRGRPRGITGKAKVKVSVRLDRDVWLYYATVSENMSAKINEVLRDHLEKVKASG